MKSKTKNTKTLVRGKASVLLVGAGGFGVNHLEILQKLEKEGLITCNGVVVKTKRSKTKIERKYKIPVFLSLHKTLLERTDAVVIVTPSNTHHALVKKCLPYANVFVEKPLATKAKDARELHLLAAKYKKKIMVGHIFRFSPVTEALKRGVTKKKRTLVRVHGVFTNPVLFHRKSSAHPAIEYLHPLDILDYLVNKEPKNIWSRTDGILCKTDIRYGGSFDAHLELGWKGDQRIRYLEFFFGGKLEESIRGDYMSNTIEYRRKGRIVHKKRKPTKGLLKNELSSFIDIVGGKKKAYVDSKIGARIIGIVENITRTNIIKRPTIGIVGGGIFVATCALVLGRYFPVTLFERKDDLMTETSWGNQYRHHMGYHYARSVETIQEIKSATPSFESFYGRALATIQNYYCISRGDSWTGGRKFLSLCKKMNLPFKREYPPATVVKRSETELCIRTPEKIFDYKTLKRVVYEKIHKNRNITLKLGTEVTGVSIGNMGEKNIQYVSRNRKRHLLKFSYVVNATYANHNVFCGWLSFPRKNMLIQFKELAILKIRALGNIGVTIINGRFPTLLPMSASTPKDHLFTLGDALLAKRKEPKEYSQKEFETWKSNSETRWASFIKRGVRWLPILKNAEYAGSIFTVLAADAISQIYDNRLTYITRHGFGCYSVLAGKIITCVQTAEEILKDIKQN